MTLEEIIQRLESATGPDRTLDVEIALAVGYQRRAANSADTEQRVVWIRPDGSLPQKIPFFTAAVDDALALVMRIAPDKSGGFSWESGVGSAKLGESQYVQSVTPAIALCIAALKHKAYTGT
ncbi:hypothetical protein SAMN02927900_03633 [Rhizobium mongolense subsp. loessense]|uniref:Phage ABA sandwich domain-containing protein n=1 Tax=Rhizobium mongolense subsp. loessense TaxID=158890 RepID=A0A1G4SDV9_9HYPH|nr:hypothetical protein [Rhizobium mongolense]SCW66735.1 hypothetical protein SAMN02927900_03633 [Rhizobium mongolense subsp. loessense]